VKEGEAAGVGAVAWEGVEGVGGEVEVVVVEEEAAEVVEAAATRISDVSFFLHNLKILC